MGVSVGMCGEGVGGARSLERSGGGIPTPITSGAVTTRLPQDSLRTSEPLHRTGHRIQPSFHRAEQTESCGNLE